MATPAEVPMALQLLLFVPGGLIMLATGLWILPGLPFIFLIKKLHRSEYTVAIKSSFSYTTAKHIATSIGSAALVDPRDLTLMVVNMSCALMTTILTVAVIWQHLAVPGIIHWPIVLLRQGLMTATLVIAFTAKHQESHRSRRATYKHPTVQAIFGRLNEWWTGTMYGNVPEIDRCGHGFVHHRNEMETDDWANSHLDRANFFQFCQWAMTAGLWHNSGLGLLYEFHKTGFCNLLQQTAIGMTYYYLIVITVWVAAGPQLFLVLFAWPFLANVGFASVINWSWHIFAEPSDPLNYAASTITVLDWAGDVLMKGIT